jgi:hypothetical protein
VSTDDRARRWGLPGLLVVLLLLTGTASGTADPAARAAGPTLGPTAAPASPGPAAESTTSAPRQRVPDVEVRSAELRAVRADPGATPVRLDVARVEISLPVVPVGVQEDRTMELPGTVREAGWYRFGPRPADRTGTTVLAAHVDTRAEGIGPFAKLRWVTRGTVIAVTDADGDVHRYRVREVAEVAKTEVALDRVFRRRGAPGLVLITCGGAYDRGTGYRDNVIVSAEPES